MPAEFVDLYEQHYGDVLRYARRRVGAELARDVAAETFTVAWRRFDQLPGHPLPWLYGVARRTLANELRAQHRRDRLTARLAAAAAGGVPERATRSGRAGGCCRGCLRRAGPVVPA